MSNSSDDSLGCLIILGIIVVIRSIVEMIPEVVQMKAIAIFGIILLLFIIVMNFVTRDKK